MCNPAELRETKLKRNQTETNVARCAGILRGKKKFCTEELLEGFEAWGGVYRKRCDKIIQVKVVKPVPGVGNFPPPD